jgi:hypothetical protein
VPLCLTIVRLVRRDPVVYLRNSIIIADDRNTQRRCSVIVNVMSKAVLERHLTEALEFKQEVADMKDAAPYGCMLMVPNRQTIELFKERPELNEAAKDTVNDLFKLDWVTSVSARASIDPETGETNLVIEIESNLSGPEARLKLDEFVDECLPSTAQRVETEITFSVVERRAA